MKQLYNLLHRFNLIYENAGKITRLSLLFIVIDHEIYSYPANLTLDDGHQNGAGSLRRSYR
jgi:hypothetical protein